MSDTIRWLSQIEDIPKAAQDPLADEVMRRFNGAVGWMGGEQVNGKNLRDVLLECWEQQNGILSCADRQRAEALGVDAIVNITALKTGVATAYLADSITSGTSELPWTIQPTPRPDISPLSMDKVLHAVKLQMFARGGYGTPAELVDHIRTLKRMMRTAEQEEAEKCAEEMMLLIQDQCAEGGFHRAMTDFIQNFPVYPFAVFAGPYVTRAPRLVWGTKKPRISTEVFPTFRSISPFDFCYSPDSPDTQRGTCVFTRTLWTRKELLDAAKLPTYIQQNVLEVLEDADTNAEFSLNWLSREPDDPKRDLGMWSSNVSPLEILTHYGFMSGRELSKYNITGLEPTEFYNCEIAMAGYRVISVKVPSDPRMQTRPIYTASFYRTGGDRIAGDGIAQRLRDIERAYLSCLRFLMVNAHNASAPLCEADYKRLAKHLSDEDLGHVVPGTMYLVDTDAIHGQQSALRFTDIPSNIPAYISLLGMFMELADRITNIPAALHGEAVGSGAMRTFRGMSMLHNNATKALRASVDNISNGVFAPMGQLLYNTNMLYSADSSIKGDSLIVTKGAEGILQKELEKQSAMEILQVIGAVGGSLAGVVNVAPVVAWSIEKLIGNMGVPDDVLAEMKQPPAIAPGGPSNPASNPAPESPTGDMAGADAGGGMMG